MNKDHKTNLIIVATISATVITSLFLIVTVTALFVAAYVLALLGIVMLSLGWLYLFNNLQSYPWLAAVPRTARRYLTLQIILSAVFVILEQLNLFSLPMQWFLLLHIFLLAFFAVLIIMLKSGKEIVEKRDGEVKEKVATFRFMQADVESLMQKFPEHEQELKLVADALRYSDPMSHPSLSAYEEQIQRGIMAMNDGMNISERCDELLRQIADRNSRGVILK